MDLNRIVEILIKKVDSEYRDDVAVICVYGSYIYNAIHAKSDIDFYFVPKSQRAYDLASTFTGLYEEENSLYNKLYHSCDIGDEVTAIMAAASIQDEIISIMGNEKYTEFFCDIIKSFAPDDLESYKKHVKNHEELFCKFIDKNRIYVRRYNSINDFENEMSEKK